jgi:hypothetical protein
MLASLRLRIIEPLIVGGYLVLLVTGLQFRTRECWFATLALTGVLAFAAWIISFRRARVITDTPTSRIASAAQGYVELVGRGHHHPGGPILSRITALPCIWYRFIIEQQVGEDKWKKINSGRSQESFMLDDGTGRCLVDPEHAEVLTARKDRWIQGNHRYTEWLILPMAKIYTIGQLSTVGGANSNLDLRQDVSDLLTTWKENKEQLLQRFDLDGDGEISEQEWMLARQQARRDVKKEHQQIRLQSGTHIVHKPRDGRLFLISDLDPSKLARRYQLWAWFHLLVLLGSVGGIAWVMTAPAWLATVTT